MNRERSESEDVVKVGALARSRVATVASSATLLEAARVMHQLDVGSAAIVDSDTLVGITTERDLLRAALAGVDLSATPVADYMTRNPASIPIDSDVRLAAVEMLALHARHLPVVDGDRVVGMLSARDLLHVVAGYVTPYDSLRSLSLSSNILRRQPKLAAANRR